MPICCNKMNTLKQLKIPSKQTANATNVEESSTTLATKIDILMERTVKRKEVSHEDFEGLPPGSNYMVLLQHGSNPRINLHALDTRMNVIDRGEKLDVGDFNDHDFEAFVDWIHILEIFFRLYKLTNEGKFSLLKRN